MDEIDSGGKHDTSMPAMCDKQADFVFFRDGPPAIEEETVDSPSDSVDAFDDEEHREDDSEEGGNEDDREAHPRRW